MLVNRLTKYYLSILLSPSRILFLIFCTIANIFFTFSVFKGSLPLSRLEKLSFIYSLPLNLNSDLFRWIFMLLPILLITGFLIFKEFKNPPIYLFFRIEGYSNWFHSIFIACLLFVIIGTVFEFIITFMIIRFLGDGWGGSNFEIGEISIVKLIMSQLIILILTMVTLLLFKVIVFVFFGNEFASLIITLIISLGTLILDISLVGNNFFIELFYAKTYFESNELYSRITYSIFSVIILYFILFKTFLNKREKILGIK